MKEDEFRLKVKNVLYQQKELSTLLPILLRIQSILSKKSSSTRELAEAIKNDTVLTAKVLRVVNSAYFGLNRKIASIDEAIVLLGFDMLRNLCAGMITSTMMKPVGAESGMDLTAMWKHSLGTACAASELQDEFISDRSCDLFVAGLLCNIGRLILCQFFPVESQNILKTAESKEVSLIEAERDVIGVMHTEVGFWAAEIWHFDDTLSEIIRHHHGPFGSKYADGVNMAYVITQAQRVGHPGDTMLTTFIPGMFSRLNIDESVLDRMLKKLSVAYESLRPVFESVTKTEM